jgi:hypothetical protein
MKHKFDGEICIYCNEAPAESKDHAVARNFFLVERRDNLPQVLACKRCNNLKSKLESYLMIVLPFGAKHPDAKRNLEELVRPRLENEWNAKLYRKLQRDFERSGGQSISLNHRPLDELFAMIAKALAWQRFGVRLGKGHSAVAGVFLDEGWSGFAQLLAVGKAHVSGDLGNGTFQYQGSQAPQYPELTLWRFEIYGGVDFGGNAGRSSLVMAATGRTEMIGDLFYSGFLKDPKSSEVGRNDPCPCGSGKKHKKCHGSAAKTEARERAKAMAAANRAVPFLYQPVAAHGHGPQ